MMILIEKEMEADEKGSVAIAFDVFKGEVL